MKKKEKRKAILKEIKLYQWLLDHDTIWKIDYYREHNNDNVNGSFLCQYAHERSGSPFTKYNICKNCPIYSVYADIIPYPVCNEGDVFSMFEPLRKYHAQCCSNYSYDEGSVIIERIILMLKSELRNDIKKYGRIEYENLKFPIFWSWQHDNLRITFNCKKITVSYNWRPIFLKTKWSKVERMIKSHQFNDFIISKVEKELS